MTSESSYSHGPTRIFLVAGLDDGNELLYIKKRWYIRISKQERLRYACDPKYAYYLHAVKKRSLLNSCAVVVKRSGGKQNHRFSSFKPDFDTAAIAAPSVAVGFDASRLGISSSIKQPSPAKASSKVRE